MVRQRISGRSRPSFHDLGVVTVASASHPRSTAMLLLIETHELVSCLLPIHQLFSDFLEKRRTVSKFEGSNTHTHTKIQVIVNST
jgi:hypothetical protein